MANKQNNERIPGAPSTLNLDRSTVRSRGTASNLGPERSRADGAVTGGDVDADVQSAYAVGDEAPGGDNPTPDQDIVEQIGEAVGLVYEDGEQLGGEGKLQERDRNRWELNPASSDDYETRQREQRRAPGSNGSAESPRRPSGAPQPDESGADEHVGATEDQVSETPAPSGDDFKDEPKQG